MNDYEAIVAGMAGIFVVSYMGGAVGPVGDRVRGVIFGFIAWGCVAAIVTAFMLGLVMVEWFG